jgi:DnaJ domain
MIRAVLILAAAGLGLYLSLRAFLNASPAALAIGLKRTAGLTLLALALGLLLLRQVWLALPLAGFGLAILMSARRTRPTAGRTSTVRSAGLEMTLDHDTGAMDGDVLAGRHEGRRLSDLTLAELLEVAGDVRQDPESLRLLEGYLDRVHPGWRDDVEADVGARHGAPAGAGGMSAQEAYEILGLQPGASDAEIRQAHRRLMKQVHPDRGGSAALAARINEAKDTLLDKHG